MCDIAHTRIAEIHELMAELLHSIESCHFMALKYPRPSREVLTLMLRWWGCGIELVVDERAQVHLSVSEQCARRLYSLIKHPAAMTGTYNTFMNQTLNRSVASFIRTSITPTQPTTQSSTQPGDQRAGPYADHQKGATP